MFRAPVGLGVPRRSEDTHAVNSSGDFASFRRSSLAESLVMEGDVVVLPCGIRVLGCGKPNSNL